jgi:hypothetical protein
MWIIGLLIVCISAISEAVMDKIQFHYDSTRIKSFKNQLFWNPSISWKNKWKDGEPKNGEKFWGSSTIFVGLTDAWHLFKTFKNLSIFAGLFLIAIGIKSGLLLLVLFIIARILYGLVFSIVFKYL